MKLRRPAKGPRIAILMYHSISKPERGKRIHPYYETCTSPGVFAQHIKFLHDNNYAVISLDEAVTLLSSSRFMSHASESEPHVSRFTFHVSRHNTHFSREPSQSGILNRPDGLNRPKGPDKPYVVLTFDDGFRDFYTHAAPILKRYGFTASVFLPTAFIAEEKESRKKFKDKDCLIWPETRELADEGISFGSHTVTHPKLIEFTRREIEYELCHSMEVIKKNTGLPTDTFCYPYSFPQQNRIFLNTLSSIMQECGYQVALTTKIGTICPENVSLFLPRIPVNDFDDNIFLARKLDGSYDWTQKLQSLYKRILKTRITSC